MEFSKELEDYFNDTSTAFPDVDPDTAKKYIEEIGFFNITVLSILEFSFYGRARHLISSLYPTKLKPFLNLNNLLADYLVPLITITILSIGISTEYITFDATSIYKIIFYIAFCAAQILLSRIPLMGGYAISAVSFFVLQILLLRIYVPIFVPELVVTSLSHTAQCAILFTSFLAASCFIYWIVNKVNFSVVNRDQVSVAT